MPSKFCFGAALGPILARKLDQKGAQKGVLETLPGSKTTKMPFDLPHTPPKDTQIGSKSPSEPLPEVFLLIRGPAMCPFWVPFDPPVKAKMCFSLSPVQILQKSPAGDLSLSAGVCKPGMPLPTKKELRLE